MSFNPEIINKVQKLHKGEESANLDLHLQDLRRIIAKAEQDEFFEGRVGNYRDTILEYFGDSLWAQVESFFKGPKDSSDESMFEWISQNYIAARLLTSTDMGLSEMLKDLGVAEKEMHEAIELANLFFSNFGPDAAYWGSDDPEKYKLDEETYRKTQENNLNTLRDKYKAFAAKQYNSADPFSRIKFRIRDRMGKEKGNYKFPEHRQDIAKEHSNAVLVDAGKAGINSKVTINNEEDKIKIYKDNRFFEADKDALDGILEELVNAKTTFNSGEYKNIISTIRKLNQEEKGPWGDEGSLFTNKQNHKAKLLTIKALVNEYIQHKADDGVKKNTYHKLAAVEKLNKFLTERIIELGKNKFNNPHFKRLDDTLDTINFKPAEYIKRDALADKVKVANELYGAKTTEEECNNTLDCMDRIIDKAKSKDALKNMQKEFLDGPGTPDLNSELTTEYINKSIKKANARLTLDESDEAYLSASLSRENYGNFDKDKCLYILARDFNFEVKVQTGKVEWTKLDSNKVTKAMVSTSKKADYWFDIEESEAAGHTLNSTTYGSLDSYVSGDMKAIKTAAQDQLPEITKNLAAKIKSDKDLVDQWSDVNLVLQCSRQVLGEYSATTKLLEQYGERMNQVMEAAKTLEKKQPEAASLH